MKTNSLFLVFIGIVLPVFLVGQTDLAEQITKYDNHGELFLKYKPPGDEHPAALPQWFSHDRMVPGEGIWGYASREQFQKYVGEKDGSWEVLQHPSTLQKPMMREEVNVRSIEDWDFYPTYDAYIDMMYQYAEDFPELCTVVNFGQSEEGRELLAAVISDQDDVVGEEPLFLYTATIHGDETAGYVLFLRLIHYLLHEYGSDPSVTNLVDNLEIWINPLANPDGTFAGGNQSVFGATRFNANLVDLNRNYPDPEDGEHPDGNPWQQETIHFMELAENNDFLMSSNIHGGSEVFNYPWDTWSQLPADDDWWNFVAREWVDTVYAHAPAGYFSGFDNGVSNGYQWYTISGGRQDYMNYFEHCREFTLEISNAKLLPASQLPQFWEYNYRSFLNYMEQALYGIQGRITDAQTGDPLKASVFIENHDIDRSWVVSNASGWFFRPVFEGTYDLTFYRPGFALKTVASVSVSNYASTSLNVQLEYTGSDVDENRLSEQFTIGNNPGNGQFLLVYKGQDPVAGSYFLCDAAGSMIRDGDLIIDLNNKVHLIDIQDEKNGVYFLILRIGKKHSTQTLIKR